MFLYIYQSNRNALKWKILFFKKKGCFSPPRHLYSKLFNMICTPYISGCPDNNNKVSMNLHYRKMVLTKKLIQGMLIIFIFCPKKSTFLSGRGSPKKSSFFYALNGSRNFFNKFKKSLQKSFFFFLMASPLPPTSPLPLKKEFFAASLKIILFIYSFSLTDIFFMPCLHTIFLYALYLCCAQFLSLRTLRCKGGRGGLFCPRPRNSFNSNIFCD